ncbi:MmcB family DNA repair protein [Niveispirillum irakense]|uniref:MmcB family DNA repair protein n=1 Tax=Niveispirillum irakense TaxID=34011 RepID=UPI00040B7C6A|nr:MmcB family DNA repair protein [Niveispirillum irakense]
MVVQRMAEPEIALTGEGDLSPPAMTMSGGAAALVRTVLPRPASDRAAAITRGVRRMMAERGQQGIVEFCLANGRRADLLCLSDKGEVTIVEVKSSVADFRADHKWQDYLEFCDCFYFAVSDDFPQELIPAECGLIVADAFGAEILRNGPVAPLPGARRKTLMVRIAQAAMARLHRLEDPAKGL